MELGRTTWGRRSWLFALVTLILLTACGGATEPLTEGTKTMGQPFDVTSLYGTWAKVGDNPCAADHPDYLLFEIFGYTTSTHDDRSPVFDGGEYDIAGSILQLSNPLGEMVDHEANLVDDVLTLDNGTCSVVYEKQPSPPTD